MASLLLEPRPWAENIEEGSGPSDLKFRVMLSKGRDKTGREVSYTYQEIEVEPVNSLTRPLAGIQSLSSLSIATS